jgi:hypothetical protein
MATVEVRLGGLLERWEELRQQGQLISPEELCSDCPELVEEFKKRIQDLIAMDRMLTTTSEADVIPAAGILPTGAAWVPEIAGLAILGELERGGMGVVYRAYDRKRGEVAAIKTMQHLSASTLYRFKQEFRTLADVAHPNLVTLYDLSSEGPWWFFTMELVEGIDFLGFVRTGSSISALSDHDVCPTDEVRTEGMDGGATPNPESGEPRPRGPAARLDSRHPSCAGCGIP